jgi:hypothetical protein
MLDQRSGHRGETKCLLQLEESSLVSCRSMRLAHAQVESLVTHASSPAAKISVVGQPVVGSGSCRLSLGLDGGDL